MFLVWVFIAVPAFGQAGYGRYRAGCADDAAAAASDSGGASAGQAGEDGAPAVERGTVKSSKSNSSERGTVKGSKSIGTGRAASAPAALPPSHTMRGRRDSPAPAPVASFAVDRRPSPQY
jgi:hypothetical protein